MENKTPIIRMDGLGKAFTGSQGTVRALEDISLEIMPGEIFGIIGLSGAGKSTLIKLMLGELPLNGQTGKIELLGQEIRQFIWRSPPRERSIMTESPCRKCRMLS